MYVKIMYETSAARDIVYLFVCFLVNGEKGTRDERDRCFPNRDEQRA